MDVWIPFSHLHEYPLWVRGWTSVLSGLVLGDLYSPGAALLVPQKESVVRWHSGEWEMRFLSDP